LIVRVLIVAATAPEVAPLLSNLTPAAGHAARMTTFQRGTHHIDVLTTGVGMVATATWCSRALVTGDYDLALNVGMCGTFDRLLALGTVVHVTTDRFAELGAEDGARFLTIHDLGLLDANEFPFTAGTVVNAEPPRSGVLQSLPAVTAITVSTVHGDDESIARARRRFSPQVESMEGAAFMYACLVHGLPFAQLRSVSNVVERRNRDAWNLPEAIRRVNATALEIVDSL
jgi:futalosine hydrolase